MTEPTHRQHLILDELSNGESNLRNNDDKDIELIWELVREGYIKNLVTIGGGYDWKFVLTDKAEQYLKSFKLWKRKK